jgi:hypothetical protein
MHMWHHVTNHLIISNDKDSNSENRIKLRIRDKLHYHMILQDNNTRHHISALVQRYV